MDRYCPNCKAKIEDGKKFCGKCGFKIANFNDTSSKLSKEKNRKIYIVISICIILCITGVIVVLSMQNNRYSPTPIEDKEDYEVVTEETPTPTEIPGRSFVVEYAYPFDGGVAWVTANDPETGEGHDFVINTDGRVLGYVAKNGNHNVVVGENGIIATPESLGYTNVEARGKGYTFVTKEVTDFENNEYYFGIVDYEGNWEMEPTRIFDKTYAVRTSSGKIKVPIIYAGEGIFQVDNTYFYNTNTHSWFEVPNIKEEANFVNGVTIASGTVIHTDGSYSKFNVSGELDKFSDGVVFNKSDYKLYDVNGSVVADLNYYKNKLSIYGIVFNNGYARVNFRGTDQEEYFVVIDKAGNQMFEPMRRIDEIGIIKYNRVCRISSQAKATIMDEHGNEIAIASASTRYLNDGYDVYSDGWLTVDRNYIDIDGNYMFKDGIISVEREIMDKGEAL